MSTIDFDIEATLAKLTIPQKIKLLTGLVGFQCFYDNHAYMTL